MAMISLGDFVIMTFDQMDEFDAFKQCECKQEYSYLKKESLLDYYLKESQKVPDIVKKFGHVYVCLHISEVDNLVKWVYEERKLNLKGKL